jgi:hypothetical protein
VLTSSDWAHVTYYLKVDDRVSKLRAEYQLIFNIDFIRVGRALHRLYYFSKPPTKKSVRKENGKRKACGQSQAVAKRIQKEVI